MYKKTLIFFVIQLCSRFHGPLGGQRSRSPPRHRQHEPSHRHHEVPNDNRVVTKLNKKTPQEMEAMRQRMLANGAWRKDNLKSNVKLLHKKEESESVKDKHDLDKRKEFKESDQSFTQKLMAQHVASTSIESSLKSRKHHSKISASSSARR